MAKMDATVLEILYRERWNLAAAVLCLKFLAALEVSTSMLSYRSSTGQNAASYRCVRAFASVSGSDDCRIVRD